WIRPRRASCELIGQLLFATVNELGQLFGDGIVHRWHFVLGKALLPNGVGTGWCVGGAVFGPLLEAAVVGDVAAVERRLEVGKRGRRAAGGLALRRCAVAAH